MRKKKNNNKTMKKSVKSIKTIDLKSVGALILKAHVCPRQSPDRLKSLGSTSFLDSEAGWTYLDLKVSNCLYEDLSDLGVKSGVDYSNITYFVQIDRSLELHLKLPLIKNNRSLRSQKEIGCPICDQGEKDILQQESLKNKNIKSRFYLVKRVLFNKQLKPVIVTCCNDCSRFLRLICILPCSRKDCGRCVRFDSKIGGIDDLDTIL
jgi:hypothetical protein